MIVINNPENKVNNYVIVIICNLVIECQYLSSYDEAGLNTLLPNNIWILPNEVRTKSERGPNTHRHIYVDAHDVLERNPASPPYWLGLITLR